VGNVYLAAATELHGAAKLPSTGQRPFYPRSSVVSLLFNGLFPVKLAVRGIAHPMKLKQSQVWKKGDEYLRIVRLERLVVDYKQMPSPNGNQGTHHQVSKKEFCRFIKDAVLLSDQEVLSTPRR
jgi:hypothetical protein